MSNRVSIFEYFKALTAHWMSVMSGSLSVLSSIVTMYLDDKWSKAIFITSAVAGAGFACYRAWAVERERAINAEKRADSLQSIIASKAEVHLDIKDIFFDPNGPTEMRIDCFIENSGRPTIIKKWHLKVETSKGEEHNFEPRYSNTSKMINVPLVGLVPEDLAITPLEEGGCRIFYLGFTILDVVPKENFGQAGTRFILSAQDVKNRPIEASFCMPLKES